MDPAGWFPLIVRGGGEVTATYGDGILTVRFRKAPVAAGGRRTYSRLPIGSAAWIDRPLNDAEPFVVKQQMNQSNAASAISVLRIKDRFWKFICRNTNNGYFDVLRSEPDFMEVVID